MKRIKQHIFSLIISVMPLISCSGGFGAEDIPEKPDGGLSTISAICDVDTRLPKGATKAMEEWYAIDQSSTGKLEVNFLRKDERTSDNVGTYEFPGWSDAYLCEATVVSSPDNTDDIHYRSILFSPRQTYGLRSNVNRDDTDKIDTTNFYHTRMVGWYPRNCSLKTENANQKFDSSEDQTETHVFPENPQKTFKAVKFTGLDGSKDVMMSNVCEGQHWHSAKESLSPYTNATGNTPYRFPFGHYQSKYSNYFKFRHYLSGIRIWGFVPEQNSHALDMWGNITDVILLNQPTSVCITIPEKPAYDSNGYSLSWEAEAEKFDDPDFWGQAYGWGDRMNLSVQRGSMFGDDPSHDSEHYTVDFGNMNMKGIGDKDHALYMGYSLIQPDAPVEVEIHTRYGVYVSKIGTRYTYTYKDGNGETHTETVDLFKPGFYYDVYLSLQTDGTISAIIETRGNEKYYDLTRNVTVSIDGQPQNSTSTYKYANCYIVDPEDNDYDSNNDGICDYDGFFFSAMVAGNGNDGILKYNGQSFYPASAELSNPITAHLVWESSKTLVTDIELINGYIKFKVPGATDRNNYNMGSYTGAKGNAVIGVYDKNGKCLWSWHIWITDTPEGLTYTSGSTAITVMDRNLGATIGGVPNNDADALKSYGLYYQWGRKDPSMGPPSYNYMQQDSSTSEFYDYASDIVDSSLPISLARPTLKDGVENPMYLILPTRKSDLGYDYDWLYFQPENILWGHGNGTDKKTIYDPCPYGYKVPAGELTQIMSSSEYSEAPNGNNKYGLSFEIGEKKNTLFFPYAGYKGVDKGLSNLSLAWSYVGLKGDYQEAVYNTDNTDVRGGMYSRMRVLISTEESWDEDRALGQHPYHYGGNATVTTSNRLLPVKGKKVFSDWANRRTAASVRCVRDPEINSR